MKMDFQKVLEKLFDSSGSSTLRSQFSRTFFYANLCQVCRRHHKESALKRCSGCKMIYYCSKRHQSEHYPIHKEFCKAAIELQKSVVGVSFFSALKEFDENDRWIWKNNIITIMENFLKRKLIPFEKEMILYPKVCLVCQEVDVNLLTSCSECPHANFCRKHKNTDHKNGNCLLFSFSCIMDCYSLLPTNSKEKEMLRDTLNKIDFAKDGAKVPSSMADFVSRFYVIYADIQPKQDIILAELSDYFTQPLTLFYALKTLNYPDKKEIILHVIGATFSELENCLSWDILLHWMPKLEALTVVFIGPECQSVRSISVTCRRCTLRGMKAHVICYEGFYKDFYDSDLFKKPDIVAGFHLDFGSGNVWKESLLMLNELKCPLILTAHSKRKMDKDHKRICEIFDRLLECICPEHNPFLGYNPHRDPASENFLHKNGFVTIYNEFWKNVSDTNLTI